MSKHIIREDKTCLNCKHVVDRRFCGNCGQENSDTRKSFYHLFIHFFEDLTHYENAFWRTIFNLILKPGALTKEYLSGKRMSYLAPVRLYIFISFVTFFLLTVIPNKSDGEDIIKIKSGVSNKKGTASKANADETSMEEQKQIIQLQKDGLLSKKDADSILKYINKANKDTITDNSEFTMFGKHYKSVHALDSVQKSLPVKDKMDKFEFYFLRKMQIVQDKYPSKKQLKEKFIESFVHNLPKALFFYMPLFAFVLWIFQSKKRWYYFDHGIFTLHYFSFLLLALLIIKIESYLIGYLTHYYFFKIIDFLFKFVAILYMLYYFFPAHHRFYSETRIMSVIKGVVMFFINFVSIIIILSCFAIYTFINIH